MLGYHSCKSTRAVACACGLSALCCCSYRFCRVFVSASTLTTHLCLCCPSDMAAQEIAANQQDGGPQEAKQPLLPADLEAQPVQQADDSKTLRCVLVCVCFGSVFCLCSWVRPKFSVNRCVLFLLLIRAFVLFLCPYLRCAAILQQIHLRCHPRCPLRRLPACSFPLCPRQGVHPLRQHRRRSHRHLNCELSY